MLRRFGFLFLCIFVCFSCLFVSGLLVIGSVNLGVFRVNGVVNASSVIVGDSVCLLNVSSLSGGCFFTNTGNRSCSVSFLNVSDSVFNDVSIDGVVVAYDVSDYSNVIAPGSIVVVGSFLKPVVSGGGSGGGSVVSVPGGVVPVLSGGNVSGGVFYRFDRNVLVVNKAVSDWLDFKVAFLRGDGSAFYPGVVFGLIDSGGFVKRVPLEDLGGGVYQFNSSFERFGLGVVNMSVHFDSFVVDTPVHVVSVVPDVEGDSFFGLLFSKLNPIVSSRDGSNFWFSFFGLFVPLLVFYLLVLVLSFLFFWKALNTSILNSFVISLLLFVFVLVFV